MKKTLDFDRFMNEKEQDTIDVTVYGKVYTVKNAIPATIPLMMARSEETAMNAEVSAKLIFKCADIMFGSKNVDTMCADGLTTNELGDLIRQLFDQIEGRGDTETPEDEEMTDEDGKAVTKAPGKK